MMKYNKLSQEERRVIEDKGTELPFSGEYNNFFKEGTYFCKKCDTALYKSENKFKSSCGWPSFDEEIKDKIKKIPDIDGVRVEIVCATCYGHLGHIFEGEGFTNKNVRHCVNSISLKFQEDETNIQKAYFAGGCFWGVEYFFEEKQGVISAISGYMGGEKENPSYEEVCTGLTKHLEVVEVTYDSKIVDFEILAKLFFEIHDFTQKNGQGPDIGSQYLSAIFYTNEKQKIISEKLIKQLNDLDYDVATKLYKKVPFYKAEDYHQDYYKKHKKMPYCHIYRKVFS